MSSIHVNIYVDNYMNIRDQEDYIYKYIYAHIFMTIT